MSTHRARQATDNSDNFDDDFESDLALPDGPLSLRLHHSSSKNIGSHSCGSAAPAGTTAVRPQTSHSTVSASTSTSGGSIIFSSSSDSASESDDQRLPGSSSSSFLSERLVRRPHTQQSIHLDNMDDFDIEGAENDEDDEKSNTIKANQLPSDFAAQLALAKEQAALAKEDVPSDTEASSAQARPVATSKRTIPSKTEVVDDDFEEDFDIPAGVGNLSLSKGVSKTHAESVASTTSDKDSTSRALHSHRNSHEQHAPSRTSSSSSWSRRDSHHTRSDTSHSHASSTSAASKNSIEHSRSDTTDDDFLDGIELPSYFVSSSTRAATDTPPSSVDSSVGKKTNLQTLLGKRLKARANLAEPLERASTSSAAAAQQRSTQAESEDRFEDAFIFEDEPHSSAPAAAMVRPRLRSITLSQSSLSLKASASMDRLSPLPGLSSRSSSSKSTATIRPSRSSLNLIQEASSSSTSASASVSHSTSQHIDGRRTISGGLRSRPSLSNLNSTSSSGSLSKAHTLSRKSSFPAIKELTGQDSHSPSSPARSDSSRAHYAQPTRSFLARHTQLSFSSFSASGSNSRPSSPVVQLTHQHRSETPTISSPAASSSNSTFSRLYQPTIASTAKIRHMTRGSDPFVGSSASLGTPLLTPSSSTHSASTSLSSLKSLSNTRIVRQPRRVQSYGDGSELNSLEDLPVNLEFEKRFQKLPMIRRRQSSGVNSVDSAHTASASVAGTVRNMGATAVQGKRDTLEARRGLQSTPQQVQNVKQKFGPAKGQTAKRETRIDRTASTSETAMAGTQAGKTKLRPALRLIRNLSAAGLSKVQGQMKWNPTHMRWEGNEAVLRDFDNVISSSARPALISPLGPLSPHNMYAKSPLAAIPDSGSQSNNQDAKIENTNITSKQSLSISNPHGTTPSLGGVRIVGDMIFDPVKMTWINTSEEGEEELNFGDDEDENQGKANVPDAWDSGEQMRLRTRRSFANDWSSNASSIGDDDGHHPNFSFEELSRKQREVVTRHEVDMRPWQDELLLKTDSDTLSRLYDIRELLDKQ